MIVTYSPARSYNNNKIVLQILFEIAWSKEVIQKHFPNIFFYTGKQYVVSLNESLLPIRSV